MGVPMTLLVSTLGFHAEKLLGAIPQSGASEVWFYVAPGTTPAKQAKVDRAVRTVERALRHLGLPFQRRTLRNPFDYLGTLRRFLDDLREAKEPALVNLTGGPKTMTVAATMACLLLGVPVVYVPEEEENPTPVSLPIVRMRYTHLLRPQMRRVLETLSTRGPMSAADLARYLEIRHSTLDYHLTRLERLGALERVPQGHRRHVAVSDIGRVLLLGLEAGNDGP